MVAIPGRCPLLKDAREPAFDHMGPDNLLRHVGKADAVKPAYGLLLLLLTVYQSLPSGAQACRMERAAVLPVRLDHGILLGPGALNGQPVQLVVDTGAEGSLVSSEAAARFPDQVRGRHLRGSPAQAGAGGSLAAAGRVPPVPLSSGRHCRDPCYVHFAPPSS